MKNITLGAFLALSSIGGTASAYTTVTHTQIISGLLSGDSSKQELASELLDNLTFRYDFLDSLSGAILAEEDALKAAKLKGMRDKLNAQLKLEAEIAKQKQAEQQAKWDKEDAEKQAKWDKQAAENLAYWAKSDAREEFMAKCVAASFGAIFTVSVTSIAYDIFPSFQAVVDNAAFASKTTIFNGLKNGSAKLAQLCSQL